MKEIASGKKIFVNRTLNMNFIKLVGFDMDYTAVTYNVPAFENLVHQLVVDKLVHEKGYPNGLRKLRFDPEFVVRGLVLDTELGNLLKVNCFGYVKKAAHGTRFMTFEEQKRAYNAPAIDLSDPRYYIVTTLFSLAEAHLFAQLVTLLEETGKPLSYRQIFHDIRDMVDIVHQEGILKSTVLKHPEQFLYHDPQNIEAMKKLKANGKKLALITNSDYEYSNGAMNYCFNPFLKTPWQDLFDIIVVNSSKPGFFQQNAKFLQVDRKDGHLRNNYEPLKWGGIYQGGNARTFERDLGLNPSEILYLGDHIFGDVVTLKEAIGWRTGLVISEIEGEVEGLVKNHQVQQELTEKMMAKEKVEDRFYDLKEQIKLIKEHKENRKLDKERDSLREKIETMDVELRDLIQKLQLNFNPNWGEIMRAGNEESRFATLVERYACIYMASVGCLSAYSPFKYFRPPRKYLPHDPMPVLEASMANAEDEAETP